MSLPFYEKATGGEGATNAENNALETSSSTTDVAGDEKHFEAGNGIPSGPDGGSTIEELLPADSDKMNDPLNHEKSRGSSFNKEQKAAERPAEDVGTKKTSPESFEVQWDGDDDPMNPRRMPTWRKWMITLTVSVSSMCVYVLGLRNRLVHG